MIETLQKMSGTTHRVYKDVKTITRDNEQLFNKAEGKISYTMTAKEIPVVSYNDMAFIGERNSIVFRAGDPPIWNRNETILPMSWRLFKDTIKVPGKEFSLQTVPTLSTALDFDVRKNTPDFMKMVQERIDQAMEAPGSMKAYQLAHGYSDYDVAQLDQDVWAEDVMDIINQAIVERAKDKKEKDNKPKADDIARMAAGMDEDPDRYYGKEASKAREAELEEKARKLEKTATVDKDVTSEAAKAKAELDGWQARRYGNGTLSRDDLLPKVHSKTGICSADIKNLLVKAWMECKARWNFDRDGIRLGTVNGHEAFFGPHDELFLEWRGGLSEDAKAANEAMEDEYARAYGEERVHEKDMTVENQMHMTDDCIRWLASLDSWRDLAEGEFDREVARCMRT